jgi:hypothetical protein
MALCLECGNQILHGCGPICLVCQHTGRHEQTATEKLMEANLKAVYAALELDKRQREIDFDLEAAITVEEAQISLRARIQDQLHSRIRPNWDEIDADERERQEVCQTCLGTRRYLTLPCPDCCE